MNSWKEKVADRLSRLLADSPSSPPSPLPRESPVVRPEPQLLPPSNEKLSSLDASFSSLLISPSPTVTRSPGGCKSNRNASRHQSTSSPIRSISRWKNKLFSWKDRALDFSSDCEVDCRRNGRIEICEDNEQQTASESDVDSPIKLDEATPKNSMKSLPDLMDDSSFLSSDLLEFLESSLPNIVRGCQWILLYSTLKHGISLRTLLRRSLDLPGPCLLVAGDMKGAVFGGLLNCPLKPTTKRKYQGTHQTFVFTTKYGEPRLFRATGANRYYYLCLNDILAFGGGGNFALCLDGDLLHGTSGPCETFGNLCLAHNSEFELKNVELWGFTHSSRVIP